MASQSMQGNDSKLKKMERQIFTKDVYFEIIRTLGVCLVRLCWTSCFSKQVFLRNFYRCPSKLLKLYVYIKPKKTIVIHFN